jgi:ABC-type multidrug transport system fused ATPase/permease subunit
MTESTLTDEAFYNMSHTIAKDGPRNSAQLWIIISDQLKAETAYSQANTGYSEE